MYHPIRDMKFRFSGNLVIANQDVYFHVLRGILSGEGGILSLPQNDERIDATGRSSLMPYFLFKISSTDGINLVKKLELIEQFEAFRDAKSRAKMLRAETTATQAIVYKVMFADNLLLAEEQLLEKREKPTLMEHEI